MVVFNYDVLHTGIDLVRYSIYSISFYHHERRNLTATCSCTCLTVVPASHT